MIPQMWPDCWRAAAEGVKNLRTTGGNESTNHSVKQSLGEFMKTMNISSVADKLINVFCIRHIRKMETKVRSPSANSDSHEA